MRGGALMSSAEAVIATLRAHKAELRAAGIARLALFGSVARGEATDRSDIDLAAEFDESRELSLLDVVRIERELGHLLGGSVELIQESCLRPRIKARFQREAIRAF
jgi:uncharacterized protein